MPGFKTQFSQFPRFVQQEGAVYTPQQPAQMPPQQPPRMPPVPQFIPPRKKSPVMKILFAVLFILILSGAAFVAVLATRAWDPMWNPFRPKPEVVFSQAILKMKDVTKYGYKATGSFSLDATNENSKNAKAQASFNSGGMIDISDILSPKFDSVLNFVLNLSISEDPNEALGVSSSGEIKSIDNSFYFKISKLEATGSANKDLGYYVSSFESVKDQWTKITRKQIESWQGLPEGESALSAARQKELESKISAVFEKYPVWKTSEELQDEKIGDISVYHYVIVLNKDNFKKAVFESMKLGAQNNQNADYFIGMAEGLANTFLEKIGEIKADIWIGKKDLLVYKVDFKKSVDLKQIVSTMQGNFSLNLNLTLSDHNKPIQAQIPFEAKGFDEVFGPFMKKAENKAKNDILKADLDQIIKQAEARFLDKKTHTGLTCKLEGIDIICSDIKAQSGEDVKVFGYLNKYCAYLKLAKLNDSDKQEYYCIDSNPSLIVTDIDPSQKGYCTGWTFQCPKPSPSPSPALSPSPQP